MKILLVAPARKSEWGEEFWSLRTLLELTSKSAQGAVLALPTLAALTPPDIEVQLVDENCGDIDFNEKVDLVGISFLTSLAPRAYEIADEFKKKGTKVVLGGIHASMLPEEAIKHADSVVIGEAEETWPELIEDLRKKELKKFYKAERFPDMSESPVPRWDLINTDAYACFTVQTGRGCPYDCDFCSVRLFNGSKYRHKPIDNVIEELKVLKKLDPRKTILFADDNFLAMPGYAKELMGKMKQLNLKKWWCQASVNRLKDEELLKLLRETGCEAVFVGFESVSQDSLKSMRKAKVNRAEEYERIIEKTHANGIAVVGSFMLGSDADTENIFKDTYEFINRTSIPFAMINCLTPTPGSQFFDNLMEKERILFLNWEKFNGENVCFNPSNMSVSELEKGRLEVLNKVYSYEAMYSRLNTLWEQGALLRGNNKRLTKGRLLFSAKALTEKDGGRRKFILKSLWNKEITSIGSISLALSLCDYAKNGDTNIGLASVSQMNKNEIQNTKDAFKWTNLPS